VTPPTVNLVQITDTHLFGDAAGQLRNVPTLPALQATLAAAAADIQGATAILATGDLVQDDPRGYPQFRRAFADLGKPVLCIPGNHDDAPALAAGLSGAPFQVGGHVDYPGWRVVLLDSSVARRAAGRLSEAELTRLDRVLADAPDRHALIALHHHPVAMHSAWLDSVGLQNADAFFQVLDRHPQVRGVVFGHVHQAYEAVRRGVRILGTPSTCAQFLPGSRDFAVDHLPPAWRTLALHANGQVVTEVAWLSDADRQRFAAAAGR
jgi:3',5'-cyclic-AMP phosphodiesterase